MLEVWLGNRGKGNAQRYTWNTQKEEAAFYVHKERPSPASAYHSQTLSLSVRLILLVRLGRQSLVFSVAN